MSGIVGIIPISGKEKELGFLWEDCLAPIGKGYTAIERAVYECAYAGCETIWIICNDDLTPLVKKVVGEVINDPVSTEKKSCESTWTKIPIFYAPIHFKDRKKRDCLGWSILTGVMYITKARSAISYLAHPDKFYVAFPYSVYDPAFLKNLRKRVASKKNFCLSFYDQTVSDGLHLGFTFTHEDFRKYKKIIYRESTKLYVYEGPDDGTWDLKKFVKRPLSERYSARNFPLDKIYRRDIMKPKYINELPWFFDISDWDGYTMFLQNIRNHPLECPIASPGIVFK